MISGDEEGPQAVDERQEEGWSLADLEVSVWKQKEGLKLTPVGKIPVYLVWRFQWVVGNVTGSPT